MPRKKSEDELHREILKEAIADAKNPKKKSPYAKILIAIGGLFLIILMLPFLLPADTLSILTAHFHTHTVKDGALSLGDGQSILFQNHAYDQILSIYYANQKSETKMCLLGYKEEDTYIVTSVTQPQIYSQSYNHVSASPCPDGTIIDLHTHPFRSCYFSTQDIKTYVIVRQRNPNALIAVMCEKDRFSVFGSG